MLVKGLPLRDVAHVKEGSGAPAVHNQCGNGASAGFGLVGLPGGASMGTGSLTLPQNIAAKLFPIVCHKCIHVNIRMSWIKDHP